MSPDSLLFQYHKDVHPTRIAFAESAGIRSMTNQLNKKDLHAFLVFFHGFSIWNTEPVEGWIRRAGEAATQKGYTYLGKKLAQHAAQEAGHQNMMIEDFNWWINKWNETYNSSLHGDEIRTMQKPSSVQAYIDLHEEVIASDMPYCQIAIEHEIERMSVDHGPRMLANIQYTLGLEYLEGSTFLVDHVKLDVGHTEFNERTLGKFLEEYPQTLKNLVEIGKRAMNVYDTFLLECLDFSKKIL